jgi:hypothetical protein
MNPESKRRSSSALIANVNLIGGTDQPESVDWYLQSTLF